MKFLSLVSALLAIGMITPAGTAYAFSFDELVEAAKNGNGTYVESHSSVSTGGETVHSGESVQTGDAHASSYTEINAGPDGGEVKVKIETSENGETKSQEYSQQIPKGEGVNVEASATSENGESNTEVKVNGEVVETESQTASAAVSTRISLLFTEKIPSYFKKFLNLFAFF